MFKLRPFVHWLLRTASTTWGRRETGRFGVLDLGSGRVDIRWERWRMRSSPIVAGRHSLHDVHCNLKVPILFFLGHPVYNPVSPCPGCLYACSTCCLSAAPGSSWDHIQTPPPLPCPLPAHQSPGWRWRHSCCSYRPGPPCPGVPGKCPGWSPCSGHRTADPYGRRLHTGVLWRT